MQLDVSKEVREIDGGDVRKVLLLEHVQAVVLAAEENVVPPGNQVDRLEYHVQAERVDEVVLLPAVHGTIRFSACDEFRLRFEVDQANELSVVEEFVEDVEVLVQDEDRCLVAAGAVPAKLHSHDEQAVFEKFQVDRVDGGRGGETAAEHEVHQVLAVGEDAGKGRGNSFEESKGNEGTFSRQGSAAVLFTRLRAKQMQFFVGGEQDHFDGSQSGQVIDGEFLEHLFRSIEALPIVLLVVLWQVLLVDVVVRAKGHGHHEFVLGPRMDTEADGDLGELGEGGEWDEFFGIRCRIEAEQLIAAEQE